MLTRAADKREQYSLGGFWFLGLISYAIRVARIEVKIERRSMFICLRVIPFNPL